MEITKSSNPVFAKDIFNQSATRTSDEVMTVNGTINKTGLMLLIVVFAATFTWRKFFGAFDPAFPGAMPAGIAGWMIGGAIGGLITALITVFSPRRAALTAPIYAVFQGLFLGAMSAMFEAKFPGLVMRAISLTFGVFAVMLMLYRSGTIRATEKFRTIIFAATGGIALVYLGSFIAGLFGVNVSFLHGNSLLSIGISLFIVVVAALNFILDFDMIDRGAAAHAPKYMEWYGAFGLMVTLIWLYMEMLRLLSKLSSRD
ncbi:MAG TPA: Bax inhibitor-1/YccA family protein [Prolixibacteraceae bacterium]|nr:Bax inhibitor-1/YccA family protein [Prolixibacteraceae bacterium]